MRRHSKSILLLFFILIILFILSEFSLRVINHFRPKTFDKAFGPMFKEINNPNLNYILNPSYKSNLYIINSKGFRSREFTFEKGDNIFRIMILGDSVTFGMGVYNTDKIYPNILEDIMNNTSDTNIKFEVINAGVPGYNAIQELNFLKDIAMQYKPDMIILGICLNDWETVSTITVEGIVVDGVAESFSIKKSLKKSLFINFVWINGKNLLHKLFDHEPNLTNSIVNDRGWEKMEMAIKEMNDFTKANNIDFLSVIFPVRSQISNPKAENRPQEDLKLFFGANEIYFLDLFQTFSQNAEKDLFMDKAGVHFSEFGHRITAETLYEKILPIIGYNRLSIRKKLGS